LAFASAWPLPTPNRLPEPASSLLPHTDLHTAACRSYFRAKGALLGDYWTGLNRSAAGADFQYSNGSTVSANNSNADPYAHWSWYHPSFASNAGYDCILAWWEAQATMAGLRHRAGLL
jgi:hypothetical protein